MPKLTNFNNGNVPYELLIRTNSLVSNLGKYEPNHIFNDNPKSVKLSDMLNTSERVSEFHYLYLHLKLYLFLIFLSSIFIFISI